MCLFKTHRLPKISRKPIDNVEPIFEIGEWIVKNDGKDCFSDGSYALQIIDNACNSYKLSNGCYLREPFANTYRLWTIQDAKDGDVLACENGWTCIFNCLNDNLFSSHCFMDSEGWVCEDGGQGHTLDKRICGEIHPATKEQRNLLFQKMREAGYEWDAEKKELKKIKN